MIRKRVIIAGSLWCPAAFIAAAVPALLM
jgi:hypothetical protein